MTAKNGKRRISHRQWALRAVLHLGVHEVRRCARNLRAGTRLGPWRAVFPLTHCRSHQQMPGQVEDDLIDSVAEPIVRFELRPESVGARGEGVGFGAARHRAPRFQPLSCPCRTFALGGASQRAIGQVQIATFKRRRLIGACAFRFRSTCARQRGAAHSFLDLELFHLPLGVSFMVAMRLVAFVFRRDPRFPVKEPTSAERPYTRCRAFRCMGRR